MTARAFPSTGVAPNLIYQVWVGNQDRPLYEVCTQSVARYCERFRVDHVVQREAVLAIRPFDMSHRPHQWIARLGYLPVFEKENAFARFTDYERICIIDSDVYIRDGAPNIFAELDGTIAFAGVLERDLPLKPDYVTALRRYAESQYGALASADWPCSEAYGPEFYNMGVMLMDRSIVAYLNGDTPEEFIRRREFERFVNGEQQWWRSTDQTLLNYWVRASGMPRKTLSWKWNALFRAVADDALQDAHFIHFFLSNKLPRQGAEVPEIVARLDRGEAVSTPSW